MDEHTFAADVANAVKNAAIVRAHGLEQTVADQVKSAVADLWECGLPYNQIRAIVRRHVVRDTDGRWWPRPFGENVVPLLRR
jgi:hypothetical protein